MALMHVNFFSNALGMCVACDVILPQKTAPEHGFKTLWLLHGMSDNHTIWGRRTSVERYVDKYDLAVVMPNGHLSSYANMAHGGKYFTYIADELPKIMRGFFPLSARREDNFISGLSMGGAGCLKIGLARPENYAVIGSYSAGAYNRKPGAELSPRDAARRHMLHGDRDLTGTEEDVFGNARRIVETGGSCPRIYHACGDKDFLLERAHETRDFFQSFPGNPFGYVYDEDPGAHTWEFWDEHLKRFLGFLHDYALI